MTDVLLFSPKQPVEIVRVLDGVLEGCEVEKLRTYIKDDEEYANAYCRQRRIRFREDGRRYILICLEDERVHSPGVLIRKVRDDDDCYPAHC